MILWVSFDGSDICMHEFATLPNLSNAGHCALPLRMSQYILLYRYTTTIACWSRERTNFSHPKLSNVVKEVFTSKKCWRQTQAHDTLPPLAHFYIGFEHFFFHILLYRAVSEKIRFNIGDYTAKKLETVQVSSNSSISAESVNFFVLEGFIYNIINFLWDTEKVVSLTPAAGRARTQHRVPLGNTVQSSIQCPAGNTSYVSSVSTSTSAAHYPLKLFCVSTRFIYISDTRCVSVYVICNAVVISSGRQYLKCRSIKLNHFFILPPDSSGLVMAFYTSSKEGSHQQDEIDFEFVGDSKGSVQTNYFVSGVGSHEKIIPLGFDCTEQGHHYTIYYGKDAVK